MNLPASRWARLALAIGIAHFLLGVWLGLTRHWGYLTSINDLGVFDQAMWGILHGMPFLNTSNDFGLPINWLGFHFNPILLAFVPFYLIYPAAEWLVIFQAAAISITAWPLYLLAARVLRSEQAAFLWSAAFLVNPFVLSAVSWDFHPVALAAPFMALGVLSVEKRDARLFWLACLPLLLVQEQYGLTVMGFGVLWWLRNRTLAPALIAICVGVAHTLLVLGVIMPALSPTGGHVMMTSELGSLSRYGWLGSSIWEVIKTAFIHPVDLLVTVFSNLGGALYLGLLLLPLLVTPLAGIEFILPGLPDLLANMLSANPMPRSILSYHSVSLLPVFVSAGIYGCARIVPKTRYSTAGIGGLVLFASLVFGYPAAPLPLPYASNLWQPLAWPTLPEKALAEIRNRLPPEASVSAQGNVAAHFSYRQRIYPFPSKVGEADFVVLRLASPTGRIAGNPSEVGSLAQHLMMPPKEYLNAVEGLLSRSAYGIIYWNPPWLVLSKGDGGQAVAAHLINSHLERLRSEWGAGKRP